MSDSPDLSVDLAPTSGKRGLVLPNPVMVASGTFGYGVEYGDIVDVEQTGVMKGGFCTLQITCFKIETSERDRRAIVPPVLLRKILDEMKGRIRPFG